MQSFVLPYESEVVVAIGIIAIVSFLFGVIAFGGGIRQKKSVRKWKSIHATADLDEVYERTIQEVSRLQEELKKVREQVAQLRRDMQKKVSSAKVQRFNAFSETGSDLSFSVALIDDEQNGVVLSSIYGREESRTYAKPVQDGRSSYTLTSEEENVISMATGKQVAASGRTR